MSVITLFKMSKTTHWLILNLSNLRKLAKNCKKVKKNGNYLPAAIIRLHQATTSGFDLGVLCLEAKSNFSNLKIWTLYAWNRMFPTNQMSINVKFCQSGRKMILLETMVIWKMCGRILLFADRVSINRMIFKWENASSLKMKMPSKHSLGMFPSKKTANTTCRDKMLPQRLTLCIFSWKYGKKWQNFDTNTIWPHQFLIKLLNFCLKAYLFHYRTSWHTLK